MTAGIKFQVLDVGQGSGNFIEIYGAKTAPDTTILIDLGSELESTAAGVPAAKYIVDKLKEMDEPTIDTMILSHSDSDHINLLDLVLDEFYPPNTPGKNPDEILRINRAFYGGVYAKYKKRKYNVLNTVKDYLTDPTIGLESFSADDSSFYASQPWMPFRTVNDLHLFLLAGNAAPAQTDIFVSSTSRKRKAPDAYAINTKSLVILVVYQGIQFLVTGDATGITLAKCNEVMSKPGVSAYLNNVFMLTVPHHGSERTIFDLCGSTTATLGTTALAQQNLTTFVNHVKAQTISASAERDKGFKHPSARVIGFFWPKLDNTKIYYKEPALAPSDRHFYTAYFLRNSYTVRVGGSDQNWPSSAHWFTIQTTANIFTNLYFVAARQAGVILPPNPGSDTKPIAAGGSMPAVGLQWTFGIDKASSNKTVAPVVNRALLLLAARQRLASVDRLATLENGQLVHPAVPELAALPGGALIGPRDRQPAARRAVIVQRLQRLRVIP